MKYNVLRKNLQTNTIDYGDVDPIFETINLQAETIFDIVVESPWVEISEDSSEAQNYNKDIELQNAKIAKKNEVEQLYLEAQFAFVKQGDSTYKITLRGEEYSNFITQVGKGVVSGFTMLLATDINGKSVVLKDLPYETLVKPLFNKLNPISEGNLILKKQMLYHIDSITDDILDDDSNIVKTALQCVNEIDVIFLPIQTFDI